MNFTAKSSNYLQCKYTISLQEEERTNEQFWNLGNHRDWLIPCHFVCLINVSFHYIRGLVKPERIRVSWCRLSVHGIFYIILPLGFKFEWLKLFALLGLVVFSPFVCVLSSVEQYICSVVVTEKAHKYSEVLIVSFKGHWVCGYHSITLVLSVLRSICSWGFGVLSSSFGLSSVSRVIWVCGCNSITLVLFALRSIYSWSFGVLGSSFGYLAKSNVDVD